MTVALAASCGCGASHSGTAATGASPGTTTAAAIPPSTASSGTSSLTATGSSGPVTATLTATSHTPTVNRPWPIRFLVTSAGSPAEAHVAYEYLFAGAVVAHRSSYKFKGSFSDTFIFPAQAVGYPLTFRAVITSGGRTINLDYPVQVKR